VVRRRVESKGVLVVVDVTSMSGGLGYVDGLHGAAPHGMVLRLLCMMIDALRCAGVAYLPGMIEFLCIAKKIL